jgi:hypothetical protein
MKAEFIFRTVNEESMKYCFGINLAFDHTGLIFEVMFLLWDFQINWLTDEFYRERP